LPWIIWTLLLTASNTATAPSSTGEALRELASLEARAVMFYRPLRHDRHRPSGGNRTPRSPPPSGCSATRSSSGSSC
ncbi:hypothetical protein ABK046_52970, partial [Streptomyces caeruleatus]